MWVFIWVLLSSIVIGATLWSLKILFDQKSAWEKFAKAHSFSLNKGTLMGPAEMNGVIGDYKFSFFAAERDGTDIRSRRMLTVMEVNLIDGLVDGAAMGTEKILPFLQTLDKLHPYKIEHPSWDKGLFAFARNDQNIKAYLTAERVDAICQLLKTKNADVLVLFNDREALVRMETSDPMKDTEKLEKVTKRAMALLEKLRLSAQERETFPKQTG